MQNNLLPSRLSRKDPNGASFPLRSHTNFWKGFDHVRVQFSKHNSAYDVLLPFLHWIWWFPQKALKRTFKTHPQRQQARGLPASIFQEEMNILLDRPVQLLQAAKANIWFLSWDVGTSTIETPLSYRVRRCFHLKLVATIRRHCWASTAFSALSTLFTPKIVISPSKRTRNRTHLFSYLFLLVYLHFSSFLLALLN